MKKPKSIYFVAFWSFFMISLQRKSLLLIIFGTTEPSLNIQAISVVVFAAVIFILIFGLIKLNLYAVYVIVTIFVLSNLTIVINFITFLINGTISPFIYVSIIVFLLNALSIYFLINPKFRELVHKKIRGKEQTREILSKGQAEELKNGSQSNKVVLPKTKAQIGFGYFMTIFAGFILLGLLLVTYDFSRMDNNFFIVHASAIIVMVISFVIGFVNIDRDRWKKLMKYMMKGLAILALLEGLNTFINIGFIENSPPHFSIERLIWVTGVAAAFLYAGSKFDKALQNVEARPAKSS